MKSKETDSILDLRWRQMIGESIHYNHECSLSEEEENFIYSQIVKQITLARGAISLAVINY